MKTTVSIYSLFRLLTAPVVLVCLISAIQLSCTGNNPSLIIKEHELTGKQWESIREIKEYWQNNVFRQCIHQSGLTLSCARCESIYLRVIIRIDGAGRLAEYTKIREHVCGSPATEKLESCFMAYLKSLQFPRNLRNMSIEMYLGNGLKC